MNFFKEILSVNDPEKDGGSKFSLSRTCLLGSFLAILFFTIYPLIMENVHTHYELATDTMITLIFLFSAYSFGNKAFKRYQDLRTDIESIRSDDKK